MKTKKLGIMLIVLLVVVVGLVFAQEPVKETVKDLRDKLFQPPPSTYEEYGWSDDTLRLYNLAALRSICENHELRILKVEKLESRILALEVQVAELTVKTATETLIEDLSEAVEILDKGKTIIVDSPAEVAK